MNFVVNISGGCKPLTASIIADYFETAGGQVVWAKPAAKKTRVGDIAGTNQIRTVAGVPRSYGRKIAFGGAIIPAEYIAFALGHSRLPKGKLVHIDGDRENNHPDNLLEIGQPQS